MEIQASSHKATAIADRPARSLRAIALLSRPTAWALFYFAVLCGAESFTVYGDARVGIGLHVALLAALLLHASLATGRSLQAVLLVLTLPSLVRITSLSLPFAPVPFVYWFLLAAVPMMAGAATVAKLLGLTRVDMGLTPRHLWIQLAIAAMGLPFGLLEYSILRPDPLVVALTWQSVLVPAVVLTVGTGFVEEFTFRGVMQSVLARAMGYWGIIYLALIFALLHLGYRSVADAVFVFAVGLFFGWITFKTNSILGPTFSHALTNVTLFIFAPLALGPWLGI